ncbi:MAG: 50S ribosomal protein L6 [Candidatus Parcubacteria bacterium]|nr:MAG: 50S ribosomal protein L6 [Candidatus Parcubacteria bacterium]
MSKIGKKPINISDNISIQELAENRFEIKGPKGSLIFDLPQNFKLEIENSTLKISPLEINRKTKPLWGTLRRLLENKIIGVSQGFEKVLILEGLGYSAEQRGDRLFFKLGFSHPIEIEIPEDIKIEIKQEKGRSLIYVRGIDKEKVGNFASQIKKLKPADRYHQKGFRYINEVIKLKPVKKAGK